MKPADAFLVSCLAAAPSYAQSSSVPVQCALEEAKLLSTPGEPKELFGWSTAVSGDKVVVGAPEVNGFNIDAGAAYVYVREGTVWSFQQKIQPGLPQEAHFGWAVAVEGDTLAVGSPEDLFPCPCPGSVYVYDRSGGSWTFVQRLTGSNGQPDYVFGHSVSISGDRILVGDAGSAYVFERQGTTWLEEVQLLSPNPFVGAAFGRSVSLSGDTAVVGARLDNCAGINAGAAYVFVDQGTTWALQGKLVGNDTTDGDYFGSSVSAFGDMALIGSPLHDDQGILASGAAYLFHRAGNSWSDEVKLTSSGPAFNDSFGAAVSLEAGLAVIGVPLDDDNGQDSGSAHVFDLLREPVAYCSAKLNSCGSLSTIDSTGVSSASDSSAFLVTASNTKAHKSGLLLYTDSGRGSLPFSGGTLCIGSTAVKRSVAVADTTGTPGQCDGTLSIDMNAFAAGALGGNPLASLTVPGTQVNCQFWGRDTLANGALLTDALEYFVCD